MKIKIACFILLLTVFTPISYANPYKPVKEASLYVTDASSEHETQSFATNLIKSEGFKSDLEFNYGVLNAGGKGTVTFTFLGSDAGYTNYFNVAGSTVFNSKTSTLDSSFSESVSGQGVLDFSFSTLSPNYSVTNAQDLGGKDTGYGKNEGSFGIVSADDGKGTKINGTNYQYLLVYNDPVNGGDKDYNDLVIGVNFAKSVAAVPEPQTYLMMLMGLALIGFVSSKRRSKILS